MSTGVRTSLLTIRSSDLDYASRLRHLLGARASALRITEHPLGGGLAALRTLENGGTLIWRKQAALHNLIQDAKLVFLHQEAWHRCENRFVDDLLAANSCRAILFELNVIAQNLEGNVGQVIWERYRTGWPDIRTADPEMLLECKFVDSPDMARIKKRLRRAAVQHMNLETPYVVAIGVSGSFPRIAGNDLARWVRNHLGPWFERHAEISAALLYTPTSKRQAGSHRQGMFIDIINRRAIHPLPETFSFARKTTFAL